MLILIAGITGNIGQHAASYGLAQGHRIRGLSRSPAKLSPTIHSQLESFVTSTSYHDIAALETAVAGVDAIICAYAGMPELHLDGQLLLLRAAERAGVTRFLTASWNYDWRKIRFGEDEPVYDAAIAFHKCAEITSSIRPLYILSGMLAEVFFGTEGQTGFTTEFEGGVIGWEDGRRVMNVWGTGDEDWFFTTEEDAGKWGVEVVTGPRAEEGGFVSVCSWVSSLNELVERYQKVRNIEVVVRKKGSVAELEALAEKKKEIGGRRGFWDWHRLWFHLFCVKGIWNLTSLQNDQFNVRPKTMEGFLKEHSSI
ncbi:NAD(P)-binding protein [Pseudovirgaria hyperparasitica]|uniref:NAD(P)-binding protein n=1 Tax=Pseudovirgaria hyperparasitica TaxID=470096 RepID=A0A6A6VU53_9PEZI|nr:NAD(P)-binding protein [Pseudovirgaria hyperparasitica]KAF2754218.1 NAD(P)-binding protein [Pseudovirgaria hyperparasitica]